MRRFLARAWLAAFMLLAAGCGGGGGTTTVEVPGDDVPFVPGVSASMTVLPACAPGSPSATNNGIDVCTVQLDLALDEPVSDFPAISVDVSGPAGLFFYSNPNPATEPIAQGRAPRSYSVSFNPGTGLATLMIYVRSTADGTHTLNISSGSAFATTADVAFATVPPPPVISVDSVTIQNECQAGVGTVEANGIALCQVSLDLNLSPASAGFDIVVTVSAAQSGLLFYSSAGEALGAGAEPRPFAVEFDGAGDAVLDFFVRSTVDGQTQITMASGAAFSQNATLEFTNTPPPPMVSTMLDVDPACQVGSPSAEANGFDVCLVTASLDLTPPQPFQLSLTASSAGDLVFYESGVEPLVDGRAPRNYLVNFDPVTGEATLEIYVRATSDGIAALDLDGMGAGGNVSVNESMNVEFAAVASPPMFSFTGSVVDAGCRQGSPTLIANGTDICQVTLNFMGTPGVSVPVTVDGRTGWVLYDSAMEPLEDGAQPRIFMVDLDGGGNAAVDVFVRSTVAGTGDLALSAPVGSVTGNTVGLEFDGSPIASTVTGSATPVAACAVGTSITANNGVALCRIDVSLDIAPATTETRSLVVSGPAGYRFYASASDAVGTGQNPRTIPADFEMGMVDVPVYVRSTASAGSGVVNFEIQGSNRFSATTEFVATPPDPVVSAGTIIVDSACQSGGGATAIGNGSDNCLVTVPLSVSPAQAHQAAIEVSGPAGMFFYEGSMDASNTGQAPRNYLMDFDPVTGQANLEIYARSVSNGVKSLTISGAGGAVSEMVDVEFVADGSAPNVFVFSPIVRSANCDGTGTPTAEANGADLCQVDVTLASSTNVSGDFNFQVIASGPSGWRFYPSGGPLNSNGETSLAYDATIPDGMQLTSITVYIRSTTVGNASLDLAFNGTTGSVSDIEFVTPAVSPMITIAGETVAAGCTSGTVTLANNGVDLCRVDLDLDAPALNNTISGVELSGPAGYLFYSNASEPAAMGANPRVLPILWFNDGMTDGNGFLTFYVRSSAMAGTDTVSYTIDGDFNDSVDVAFTDTAPDPVISIDSNGPLAECDPGGTPTATANGSDTCRYEMVLSIDPPQAHQLSVEVTGAAQFNFYESTGDPVGSGFAPRDFLVEFDPISGKGMLAGTMMDSVQVVVRSNATGQGAINLNDAAGDVMISDMVEFVAPPPSNLVLGSPVVDAACDSTGSPTATANGSDVCQVTLPFTGDDGTYPVTVSGPSGWELFDAAMDAPGSGSLPRVYELSVGGGSGNLDVFIRSSVVGVNNLTVVANDGDVNADVPTEFIDIEAPPAISGGAAVASVCAPGTASAQNNGVDLCQVTLSLSREPAEIFSTAASVSGPAGYLFYGSPAEAIGAGQASRIYPVDFDASGDATVEVYVRSTAPAGSGQLDINVAGVYALAPTVAFVSTQSDPTVMASAGVDAACRQGTSSTEANASDLCTVTLDLTVSPPQPFQLALNASGPAGVLFYDSPGDPLASGQSRRTYLADFDGVTGEAQVVVPARSATAFSDNLVFTSTEASVNAPVEFIAVQSPPTVDSVAVTGAECRVGDPTATNNGIDTCLITLTLTPNPLMPVDFALAVSGPVGYAFYESDTEPVEQGSAPRVYPISLDGSGPQDVEIRVRSTRAGQGTVSLVANGILNIDQSVEFAADSTFVPPELVIGDECTPAMATAQANGVSTCKLTLNLTLSPPDPDFFDIAVGVSSDSGYLFYGSLGEPINMGQTTRIFPVSFDPDTGLASLDVWVRSNTPGIGNVSFASGGRVDITEMIEFDVDASSPASIELSADSFVGDGGSSPVTAIVKNANGDPIPSSAVQFTIDFTSNDPNGLFSPAHPTIVRAGQDKTDGSGAAMATFSTQNFDAHTVTITAEITDPVVSVPAAQVMISVFDQVSAPSKAQYQVVMNHEGRSGQAGVAASNGVDGFFGNSADSSDILEVDVQIRSVDEISEGMPCDCDPAVDGNACTGTGPGQVACPLNTTIELDCPSGLGNPTPDQCKFAGDLGFNSLSTGCTNGINFSCFRFSCPGGAGSCETTLFLRIPSKSVAKQTGFPDDPNHYIRPRVFAGGAQLATSDVERTEDGPGQPQLIADSMIFLPDPQLPSDAYFTKPVCGAGVADQCDTGSGDAGDGGLNQNCEVLTTDSEADMTIISCSDDAADYELPDSDPARPRVPVWFEIRKVLGEVLDPTDAFGDGNIPVTFIFDGPSGTGLGYEVCDGPASICRPSMDGDVVFDALAGNKLSDVDDRYLYPPFSPTTFGGANGISVSIDVPDVVGFVPATKKLLFNPACTTPVAIECEFAGDDSLVPGGTVPACFSDRGGRPNAYADGAECEYVECRVVSFAESVPGPGPSIGPVTCNDEPVPDEVYSMRVFDDGDTEEEEFCELGNSCTPVGFLPSRDLTIDPSQTASFYVRVNNNQTASPSIQADFRVRLRKFNGTDLSPVDLIETVPPFTMDRDPTLPASLQIAFEDSLGTPITEIYTQHAASDTTAPELFNFYGMNADTKYGDLFAARVMVTIKDFNGDDYVTPGDNPACQVRLSASGSAAGTTFPTLSAGNCDAPLEAPKTLSQSMGDPVVAACLISNGNVNAAGATATVSASFIGGCTTGMNSDSITVRSVPRSARFRYDVTNTAGSSVAFTGLQANADLDTTIFCTPEDSTCSNAGVPQPEDFFPIDLLLGKGPQGELVEDGMGGAETRALYSEIPPGTCNNAFSIGALATRGVWTFDLSLHPDPDGDGAGPGELQQRLDFDVGAIPIPTITDQEVTQRFVNQMAGFCDFGTISEVEFSIQQGTPLYFGAP